MNGKHYHPLLVVNTNLTQQKPGSFSIFSNRVTEVNALVVTNSTLYNEERTSFPTLS